MNYCISFSQELQRVFYFTFCDQSDAEKFIEFVSSSMNTNREEADEENHPTEILYDNDKEAVKEEVSFDEEESFDDEATKICEEDSFDEEESFDDEATKNWPVSPLMPFKKK